MEHTIANDIFNTENLTQQEKQILTQLQSVHNTLTDELVKEDVSLSIVHLTTGIVPEIMDEVENNKDFPILNKLINDEPFNKVYEYIVAL